MVFGGSLHRFLGENQRAYVLEILKHFPHQVSQFAIAIGVDIALDQIARAAGDPWFKNGFKITGGSRLLRFGFDRSTTLI